MKKPESTSPCRRSPYWDDEQDNWAQCDGETKQYLSVLADYGDGRRQLFGPYTLCERHKNIWGTMEEYCPKPTDKFNSINNEKVA